jgi:hypothetical protein
MTTLCRNRLDFRRIALAVCIGLGVGLGLFQLSQGFDGDAYWNAALRLREGQQLYISGPANDPTVYRYPPWFAWAWMPLTFLPYALVMSVWRVGLVLAALALIPPLWRHWTGRAGLCLFVPMLMAAGWQGNVQPAVVALTVYGTIGLAAGIKVFPLVGLLPNVLRREWQQVAVQLAIAAALWAPILLYDLSDYPTVRGLWLTDLAVLLVYVSMKPDRTSSSLTVQPIGEVA